MRSFILLLLGVIMLSKVIAVEPIYSVEMSGPEGVTYDDTSGNFYIVDATDGIIYTMDNGYNISTFKSGLNSLMKPLVIGDLLFVSSNDPDLSSNEDNKLHKFNIETGELYPPLDLSFTGGIGGIAYNPLDQMIYLVSQIGGLFKIDPTTLQLETISETIAGNDICFDDENSRFIIAKYNSKIHFFDPNSGNYEMIGTSIYGSYTAIFKDGDHYYLSDWSGKVYQYDSNFTQRDTLLTSEELNNPVGLYVKDNRLYLCDYTNNSMGKFLIYDLNLLSDIGEVQTVDELGIPKIYPNPFNPSTTISFTISKRSMVNLSIFNSNGELVKELIDREMERGDKDIVFSGSNLNSGNYFYKLKVGEESRSGRIVLIK